MLRTIKLTSPMSLGSWILSAFSAATGVAAASEIDRMTGERLPLGPLRQVLRAVEGPAGMWSRVVRAAAGRLHRGAARRHRHTRPGTPLTRTCRSCSSARRAWPASGLAMITTPVSETGPARRLAVLGVVGDLVAMRVMERRMDPVAAEPLHHGGPGRMLQWSERLAVAGGLGTLLGGRRRGVAVTSGLALMAASALTRFGVFEAGLESAQRSALHHRAAEASAGRPTCSGDHRRLDHHRTVIIGLRYPTPRPRDR